jgi:hypothetical protein
MSQTQHDIHTANSSNEWGSEDVVDDQVFGNAPEEDRLSDADVNTAEGQGAGALSAQLQDAYPEMQHLSEEQLDIIEEYTNSFWDTVQVVAGLNVADPETMSTVCMLIDNGEEVAGDLDEILEAGTMDGYLQDLLDELGYYTECLDLHLERETLIQGLPDLKLFAIGATAWAAMLQRWSDQANDAAALLAELNLLYHSHEQEFEEACMKVGVDVALIAAGIAAAALLTGPAALVAGVALACAGVGASFAIEGGLSNPGTVKTTINGINLASKGIIKNAGPKVVRVSKGLGPAMNAMSLVVDGLEAGSEKRLAIQVLAKGRLLMESPIFDAWPAIAACLGSATKQSALIANAVGEVEARIQSLDIEIEQAMGSM